MDWHRPFVVRWNASLVVEFNWKWNGKCLWRTLASDKIKQDQEKYRKGILDDNVFHIFFIDLFERVACVVRVHKSSIRWHTSKTLSTVYHRQCFESNSYRRQFVFIAFYYGSIVLICTKAAVAGHQICYFVTTLFYFRLNNWFGF